MTHLVVYTPGHAPSLASPHTLDVLFSKFNLHLVSDASACEATIQNLAKISPKNSIIFLSNHADFELFNFITQIEARRYSILVTNQSMSQYSESLQGKEINLLDHVVANRGSEDSLIRELGGCMHKLHTQNIFGLDAYMRPTNSRLILRIDGSHCRDDVNQSAYKFAESCGMGQQSAKSVFGIVEEMIMNAIYDAPVAAGNERIKSIGRMGEIILEEHESATLDLCCDGDYFGISIVDPFGALDQKVFGEYIRKVLKRHDELGFIDQKEGGAGLGLFKILYSSHALISNCTPKKKTEMIALIDLNDPLRDFNKIPRSIGFFKTLT